MSKNPSVALGSHTKRPFAESNPHTLVGLQKVKVQLEKEISKLDKQQATAVTNIANHQQAMKMTWRQLQTRRMMESPSLSKSKQDTEESGPRRGLFHSKTKLYVRNTPDIYHPETEDGKDNTVLSSVLCASSSATGLGNAAPPINKRREGFRARGNSHGGQFHTPITARHMSSPYISSPYNFRRESHFHQAKISVEANDNQHIADKGTSTHPEIKVRAVTSLQRESLKLPPIVSSSSQHQLVTSSSTTDKKTLLKASAIIGGDLTSHSAASFKGFYSNEKLPAQPIIVSPVQPSRPQRAIIDSLEDDDQGKKECEQMTSTKSSEPTLAEQFEQIKHCRYIRRYHPDGTALEEYY